MKSNTIQFRRKLQHPTTERTRSVETKSLIVECVNQFMEFKLADGLDEKRSSPAYRREIDKFIRFLKKGPLTPISEVTEDITLGSNG